MRFPRKMEIGHPGNHGVDGIAGTLSLHRTFQPGRKACASRIIGRVTALPPSVIALGAQTTEQETAHLDKLIPERTPVTEAARNWPMPRRIGAVCAGGRLSQTRSMNAPCAAGPVYARRVRPDLLIRARAEKPASAITVVVTGLIRNLYFTPTTLAVSVGAETFGRVD